MPRDAGSATVDAVPAPPRAAIELTFTGDVMFGRWVPGGRATIPAGDYDLFGDVADAVRSDLAMANLETPLLRRVPAESPYGTRLRFAATPEEAAQLVRGGFTHVTLANNHNYDMHLRGVLETPVIARELGLEPIGESRAEEPMLRADTVELHGWRLAFIGVTTERNGPQRKKAPLLPFIEEPRDLPAALAPVIRAARAEHDVVIVVAHWGEEYDDEPKRAQRRAAHALIEAGADLIVGHHPHILQGVERHAGGLVAYSLGNFRFDYARGLSRLTGVLRVRFERGQRCPAGARFHPAVLAYLDVGQERVLRPTPATGSDGDDVRARVEDTSRKLGATWARYGDDLVLTTPCPG